MLRLPLPLSALFAPATLLPLGLIVGAWAGLVPAWAAALYLAVLVPFLDALTRGEDARDGIEFPGSDILLLAVAVGHFALLPLVAAPAAGLTGIDRAALAFSAGLWIGQVAVPAAHELIHRSDRRLFRLGAAMYSAMLFGHHTSAHRLVHHRRAASPGDPNSAREGEGFYAFFLRAWAGSFSEGMREETARRKPGGVHPYVLYSGGAALALCLAWWLGGAAGLVLWLAVSLHAQVQLLLADYVQHYGLSRRIRPDGRLEPVSVSHAWNAAHRISALTTLHAPRHSDHHVNPAREYPALRMPQGGEAPVLPVSLPVACSVALVPPLWRRMMDPRLARWRARS